MTKPRIRASGADRQISCPASRIVEGLVGKRPGDEVAWEGTMLHWEIAWRLVRELGAVQPEGGIPLPKGIPPNYKLPSYVAWIVDWCFDIAKEQSPPGWALEVEGDMEWEFEHFILCGHPDKYATSPDGREGMDNDWKAGRTPVDPADENWQVASYMALRERIYGLEKLRYEIDQPWNDEDAGFQRQSAVELEGAALLKNTATLEEFINDSLNDAGLLNTGKHCQYCVGFDCPAIRELHKTMKMRLTPEMIEALKDRPATPELVDLVMDARVLKKPISDIEEVLKSKIEEGGPLASASGLVARIQESSGGYEVVDAPGMFSWLGHQLTPEQMAPALSYPSGKIKDALAKGLKIPKTGKAAMTAETVFQGAAAAFLTQKTKRTLVIA